MKLSTLLLIVCGSLPHAKAAENWMLSTPELLPSPINLSNSVTVTPWLSADDLKLYFASDRPGGYGRWDLWLAERSSVNEGWGMPVNLGPTINTSSSESMPSLSADGLTLYFADGNPYSWSPRAGGRAITSSGCPPVRPSRVLGANPWTSNRRWGVPILTITLICRRTACPCILPPRGQASGEFGWPTGRP